MITLTLSDIAIIAIAFIIYNIVTLDDVTITYTIEEVNA